MKHIPLVCVCCGLPFAYLTECGIVIMSRHHGEQHENVIPIINLKQLRQKEGAPDDKRTNPDRTE